MPETTDHHPEITEGDVENHQLVEPPIDEVLVPMDYEGIGRYGLDQFFPVINCCDATVHVLFVRKDPKVYTRDRLRFDSDKNIDRLSSDIKSELERKGLTTTTEVRSGLPQEEIISYVDETDVNLVLMTTHGRTGVDYLLHGSVTDQIIRNISVPVLVVKYEE